jgi:drug/metabolite transporter (DMT)-like permease
MLIAGALLALVCGLGNSGAAVLEKREMVRDAPDVRGVRVLVALVRRPLWLIAMLLSFVAWVAEAGALALAPVPVVTTLRSLGRGGLVLAGHRWLGERFGRLELAGVALLTVGGILTASSVAEKSSSSPPLSNFTELLVALAAALIATALSRRRSGVALGSAVGVLFVATGVFTKEIGDGFARDGFSAIIKLLLTPGPWVMVILSVWAISLLQHAFQRSNAATVSAASTTISANGLIAAGVALYHEPLARGANIIPLLIGIVVSALGALALARRSDGIDVAAP